MGDYKDKKVVIMGLGRMAQGAGFSAAKFFAEKKARVVVTDLREPELLNKDSIKSLKKYKNVKFVFGKHNKSDFKFADIIIRNPAVKPDSEFLQIAREKNVKITTDLEVFFQEIKGRQVTIVGITGTRGKSTTTSLVYKILKTQYKDQVHLGGNIGNSPLNFINKVKDGHIVVMEIASFQLNSLSDYHFNIAAITNIMPDHMDYYKSMAQYIRDKAKIFKTQTQQDYLILNKDDKTVNKFATKSKSKIIYSGKNNKIKLSEIKLLGEHSLYNIDVAWKIAKLLKVPETKIKKVVINFSGVKDRLELIRNYKGVRFYNDTTATHPKATVVAINSFPEKKVILISGGNSKNLSLQELNTTIKNKVKQLILVPGNANKQLPEGIEVVNIAQAVKIAFTFAKKGDTILFSPGLTWLPAINEFKRGEIFTELVNKIK